MSRTFIRLILLSIIIGLAGCADTPDGDPKILKMSEKTPNAMYQDAQKSLQAGNIQTAIEKLQVILSRYPFGSHVDQVQLDLIFAHYRTGDSEAALAAVDRFIRLNPDHKDMDYALYMRGLINLDMDSDWFHSMLNIDRTDRDPASIREAFNDFAKLLKSYPDSKYAADAQKRMLAIKERLAGYEIKVAEYYISRQSYVAAITRAKYILEYYPDVPASVEDALGIMVECYDILELNELKQDAMTVLRANFPNNPLLD